MSQADFGPGGASNVTLPPAGEREQHVAGSSGTSVLAALIAVSFLVMAMFFVLSFVAVWKRSEGRNALVATAVVENRGIAQSPNVTDQEIWLDATVNIKGLNKLPGNLRAAPEFSATIVADFLHGRHVKVAQSSVEKHETWYRVKGTYKGAICEGWMHSDILIVTP